MKRPAIRVGAIVEFKSWLFKPPYDKYFEKYKDKVFKIVATNQQSHYYIECINDNSIVIEGGFHLESLKLSKVKVKE